MGVRVLVEFSLDDFWEEDAALEHVIRLFLPRSLPPGIVDVRIVAVNDIYRAGAAPLDLRAAQ